MSGTSPRSRLLSEPARVFGNHDPALRDLLLEYFIPVEKFGLFVKQASASVQSLNRYQADARYLLRIYSNSTYADQLGVIVMNLTIILIAF